MSLIIKSEEIIVDSADYNSDEGDEVHLALDDSGGEGYQTVYTETIPTQKHSGGSITSSHQPQQVTSSPRGGGLRTVTIQQLQNQQNVNGSTITVTKNPNQQSAPIQTSKVMMENEKRLRREIANSNERRRMQSINAGFQSLRSLLPHHEGEKLSKAAILQQTAQYILDLESEKTQLLSQNSQLKRQHCQHEGCTNAPKSDNSTGNATGINNTGTETVTALKKRKLTDSVISMQAISDSSDEGLGSMSPEPVTLITASGVQIQANKPVSAAATAYISSTGKEVNELKVRLENERKRRRLTEERVRILEKKLHLFEQDRQVQHQHHYSIQREVIEHTDNIRDEDYEQHIIHQPIYSDQEEIKIDPTKLQVVELNDIPVGQTQVVICSQMEDMQDDEAAEIITADIQNIREEVIMTDENTEILEVPSRLQPILEAAIKAEPKVEVERINATLTKRNDDGKRMYLTSTSRQNLETIVEAIRHLEGDHLFADSSQIEQEQIKKSPQEAPLALTTSVKQHQIQSQAQQQQQPQIHQVHTQALTTQQQRKLTSDLSPFLQLKAKPANVTIVGKTASSINNSSISQSSLSNPTSSTLTGNSSGTITLKQHATTTQSQIAPSTIITTQLKQCRPGVIVAKQVS